MSSSSLPFKVGKISDNALAFSNHVYLSGADAAKFSGSPYVLVKTDAAELVFNCAILYSIILILLCSICEVLYVWMEDSAVEPSADVVPSSIFRPFFFPPTGPEAV